MRSANSGSSGAAVIKRSIRTRASGLLATRTSQTPNDLASHPPKRAWPYPPLARKSRYADDDLGQHRSGKARGRADPAWSAAAPRHKGTPPVIGRTQGGYGG